MYVLLVSLFIITQAVKVDWNQTWHYMNFMSNVNYDFWQVESMVIVFEQQLIE